MWRPEVINRYIPVDYSSDIDEGFFDYKCYGKAVFRLISKWKYTDRQDLISYQEDKDSEELHANIRIGKDASNEHKSRIMGIVKKYWDFFGKKGVRRPILNYEFSIDAGTAKPVCCKEPCYESYESKIIMEYVTTLLKKIE